MGRKGTYKSRKQSGGALDGAGLPGSGGGAAVVTEARGSVQAVHVYDFVEIKVLVYQLITQS